MIMPPILNKLFLVASTAKAKKILIATSIVILLYIALGTETSRSYLSSYYDVGHLKIQPPEIDDAPLGISQWGERGKRVEKLARWAELLVENPRADRRAFHAALTKEFPFLRDTENSIYAPWSSSSAKGAFSDDVGIVLCTGSRGFHLAAHLISSLRRVHKSQVHIEVAYGGDDDLKPKHREYLANLEPNVTFIDLLERFPAARSDLHDSGWAMKPFAMLASSHSRTLLLDADALFLTSPDNLFEVHPGLQHTGTLLFHDRAAQGEGDDRRFWVKAQLEKAGIEPSHYLATESLFYSGDAWYEADSGAVALDKTRPAVLMGLIFAAWMNTREVRDEVSYKVFYGDKETFWLAMEFSSVEYFFQPWYAGSMGQISLDDDQATNFDFVNNEVELCGTHMLHLDHTGTIPFWINGGVYEHKAKPEGGYAKMTHYWFGDTSDIRLTKPEWYWKEGNVGCLKSKGVQAVPHYIKKNFEGIVEEAKRVDEEIRNLG